MEVLDVFTDSTSSIALVMLFFEGVNLGNLVLAFFVTALYTSGFKLTIALSSSLFVVFPRTEKATKRLNTRGIIDSLIITRFTNLGTPIY